MVETLEANSIFDQLGGKRSAMVSRAQNQLTALSSNNWNSIKRKLVAEQYVLEQFVLGCDIWISDYVIGPLDRTNNRIYNSLYVGHNLAHTFVVP